MNFPDSLKYTKDHEWALVEGTKVTIGITDHAQNSLGDIVFVEVPKIGRVLKAGETFGVVESIKAVSDLYSPVAGKVLEVNGSLAGEPSQLNSDPYGKAWIAKIEMADASAATGLMDSKAYATYVKSLS